METETVNKLFLELSQVATAKTEREIRLLEALKDANDKLRSAHEIAKRRGVNTNWPAFINQVAACLTHHHRLICPTIESSGWVIERDGSDGSMPEYFIGVSTHLAIRWSNPGDHADACRFCRKQDAERVAAMDPGRSHRITEHGWDEPLREVFNEL